MIERGRKFIRLRERQHYEYEGAVEALDGAERQQADMDDGYVPHLYKTIVSRKATYNWLDADSKRWRVGL